MEPEVSELAAAIGRRVAEERRLRGWTLDVLADVSGVSRRQLVTVEQGTANPSLAILLKLSSALGIALPVLVEPTRTGSISVTRADSGPVLWRGPGDSFARMDAGVAMPDAFELWSWRLDSGAERVSAPHAPGSRELLHVLEGELTLTLGSEVLAVGAGDSVAFAGDIEHSYRNDSPLPAVFTAAMFEPAGR